MMSSWEIVTLVFIALLVFGPERLPEMARTAGKTITRLRREATSTLDEIKRASEIEELRKAANVDELRDVAGELRAEADSIKAEADSMSRTARGNARPRKELAPDAPPPFDPDAT